MLQQAVRNSLFNGIGTASNLVLGILFAGLTIRYLGEARAGYLLTLQAVLGVNALIGGQVFRGLGIQRLAALAAERDWRESRRVVATVATSNAALGVVLAGGLLASFPHRVSLVQAGSSLNGEAAWATIFTALAFVTDQLSGAPRMVYDARQRFDLVAGMTAGFALFRKPCPPWGLGNLAEYGERGLSELRDFVALVGM